MQIERRCTICASPTKALHLVLVQMCQMNYKLYFCWFLNIAHLTPSEQAALASLAFPPPRRPGFSIWEKWKVKVEFNFDESESLPPPRRPGFSIWDHSVDVKVMDFFRFKLLVKSQRSFPFLIIIFWLHFQFIHDTDLMTGFKYWSPGDVSMLKMKVLL